MGKGLYRLAPALSHIVQLVLATLPLFLVLLYFIYLTAVRPANNQVYDDDQTEPLINLQSILYTFLSFFCFWICTLVYMGIYVPKRHALIDAYVTQAKIILGDVRYTPRRNLHYFCTMWKRFAPEYAVVTYRHPYPDDDLLSPDEHYVIVKRVRTYQPYSREKVNISVLPGLPRSGQPQSDVEYDFASFTENVHGRCDRSWGIIVVSAAWTIFTFLGSVFTCFKMQRLGGKDLDIDAAREWTVWASVTFAVAPVLAFGLNWIRWNMHRRWLTQKGKVVVQGSPEHKKALPGMDDDVAGCDACEAMGPDGLCGDDLCRDDEDVTPYKGMD